MIGVRMPSLSDFSARDIRGVMTPLSRYAPSVVLVVNTASNCRFTPQLQGLQALYESYSAVGFAVLGFPCNQFADQDPGTPEEIAQFCSDHYAVTFPMFDKIEVNGNGAHPLFRWLRDAAPGALSSDAIKWNFTKFLLDHTGTPVVRYAPTMEPNNIAVTIERLLRSRPDATAAA